jgi:serine/threonine protein kinase
MPSRLAATAAGATTTRPPPTRTTSTATATAPLSEEPLPFPGITLGMAKYQKIWARGADTRPQYVDALISPTTGHAFIKIRDIHPAHTKPLYLCSELAVDDDDGGLTYVPTVRGEVVIKVSRVTVQEVEVVSSGLTCMPRRRGADEPLEEVKAMRQLMGGKDRSEAAAGVVPLLDSFVCADAWLYLVQPFYAHGDLVEVLSQGMPRQEPAAAAGAVSKPPSSREDWVRCIFVQLLGSLALLKKRGVAHLDLSPENVFVEGDGTTVALGDLGMALFVGPRVLASSIGAPPPAAAAAVPAGAFSFLPCTPPKPTMVASGAGELEPSSTSTRPRLPSAPSVLLTPQRFRGKLAYAAPEVLDEVPFDPYKVDIFSLGCTLFSILTGRLFLEPSNAKKGPRPRLVALLAGDFATLFHLDEQALPLPRVAADLIRGMVQADPAARLSLEEVMVHPWVVNARA